MSNSKKIFEYQPIVQYSFGSILIAADSKEEADKIVAEGNFLFYSHKYEFKGEIDNLFYSGESGVVFNNEGSL
jgi:hypothetical protein